MIRTLLFLVLWAIGAAPLQAQDAARSRPCGRNSLSRSPAPRSTSSSRPSRTSFANSKPRSRVATQTKVSERDLASAYASLGRLCHAHEFFDAAEAAYANALRLAPQDAASLHLLGYLYQQTGRYEEAVERYSAARRAKPNDREVQIHLAEVSLSLNRLAERATCFSS